MAESAVWRLVTAAIPFAAMNASPRADDRVRATSGSRHDASVHCTGSVVAARPHGDGSVYVNVGELFSVGPGPSSSRTIGPLLAARRFVHEIAADGVLPFAAHLRVELFGGLACTGRDLGSDRAILAGLSGLRAEVCDNAALARCAAAIARDGALALNGRHMIAFALERDIAYCVDRTLAYDGNAIRFVAQDSAGKAVAERLYFSTGGGKVVASNELGAEFPVARVPYPFTTADHVIELGRVHHKKLVDMALANACVHKSPGEVRGTLLRAARAMQTSIERGLAADDPLPGGAPRHAGARAAALRVAGATPTQRCSVYATAVAEENSAGGLVVGVPSTGAAGPVAALLRHCRELDPVAGDEGAIEFLMVAAAIGGWLRAQGLHHAGCQSEVGLAAAMAAAGFAAVQGGSNAHVLYAAELALEPHLGLSCDPEGARIQQPCIDRNATAAARALAAASEALRHPMPRIKLDALVHVMVERGRGMAGRYKQASLGGVAISVADC